MRRSTRIRWEIPVLITSLAPGVEFSECCDTVAVNAHGCGIITTTRLEKGIPVKLSLLPNSQEATAHIADVVPLGEDGKSWLLGIQLNEPRNVWGVTSPPEDWNLGAPAADPALTTLSASATVDSSLPSELGLLETAARAAAVGAGAASPTATSPLQSAAPLNRRKSPGQSPSVGVIEPQFSEKSLATLENSSGDRLDPLDLFEAKLRDRAKSVLQEFEKDSRRRTAAASADAPRMRERDWGHIREEVEDHLKDVIWQFDGKVENKLETWRQEMADTETKLSHLQADVESQLKELRELIRDNTPQPDEIEKWGLELQQPISERPGTSLESASAGLDPAALEQVRELQEWKESLVAQLPHIIEQQVNLAAGTNDKRLQSESQEVLSRIQAELQDLKLRLEQLDAAQQLAHSAARADFATAEQAMQT